MLYCRSVRCFKKYEGHLDSACSEVIPAESTHRKDRMYMDIHPPYFKQLLNIDVDISKEVLF